MNERGTILVFNRENEALLEYLNSLYKESPTGEPLEPLVRAIQTVSQGGRKIAIVTLGNFFQENSKVVKLIIDALIKLNMPIKIESGNREIEKEDFDQYMELNDKVIILEIGSSQKEPLLQKYGGMEFKKKVTKEQRKRFPALIHWLETQAICPEITIFELKPPPWKESESEDIAYSVLGEIME